MCKMDPSNTAQTITDGETGATTRKSTKIINAPAETAYIFIPPDGGWGWIVVISAFVCYFIADGLQYSYGIFLNDIATTFACPTSSVSLAGAISTCVFCVSGPFSAALVNRFGYRVISITGSVLATVACVLTSFSSNIYFLYLYYGFIGGLGYGMIYITSVIAVGFYFEKWRGLATGISVCGAGLGSITLPPVLTLAMGAIGWRQTFQCLSVCTLCLSCCGYLLRPLKPSCVYLNDPPQPVRSVQSTKASRVSFYEKYVNRNFNTLTDQKSIYNDSSETIFLTMYQTSDSPNASGKSARHVDVDTNDLDQQHSEYSVTMTRRFLWAHKLCPPCQCRPPKKRTVCLSRPIYRDDIFYMGSLARVPQYQTTDFASRPNLEYHLSVTRQSASRSRTPTVKRRCCSESVKRTLATMLDFRAVRSFKFAMLICNGVFVSLGIYIPYMFIKDASLTHGVSENLSSWLISAIGISNTMGRIVCGLLSTSPKINSIVLCYTMLLIGGVATALSRVSYLLWVQFAYCSLFGFTMSSISALKTLIIVQMVGLENLTNAIGIILMFQGFASLCGLALAGYLRDITSDYAYSFYFGGFTLSAAALFLIALHCREQEERKHASQIDS